MERLAIAKKAITEAKKNTTQLITKQNTVKMEFTKAQLLTKKAEEFKEPAPKEAKEIPVNLFAEFGFSQKPGADGKPAKQKINMCTCGARDPEFKGYCEDCVKKLSEKFTKSVEKFNKLKKEYDEYSAQDNTKADEKMKLLKNKMAQYGAMDAGMMDVISKHEKLMNSGENRAFAEFKVGIQSMKQEIKIIKARQEMELDELRKQQNNLDVQIVKQLGTKRELDYEIDNLEDQTEEVKSKLKDMEQLVTVKKRFVLHVERLEEQNIKQLTAK